MSGCASLGDKPDKDAGYIGSIHVGEESEALQMADAGLANTAENAEAIESVVVDIEPTVVEYDDYRDPLIGVNRAIFAFNDVTFRYALIPLSKGYIKVTPRGFRNSVTNFFYNIKMPIYLVNNALQLKFGSAAKNVVRFGINSTIGLFGFFDPAKEWFNIEKAEANLGDTLEHYGVGYGIYLVLPLLGPSDLRDGASDLADYRLSPLPSIVDDSSDLRGLRFYSYFNDAAPAAEQYETLREESEDPYIFFRNLYLQGIQRDADYPRQ